jgi:hypothetical protein
MRLRIVKHRQAGFTLAEIVVSVGIGTAILAAFTWGSVALQRSFAAIEDYAKGMNDQMRISDYLAMDMRRAFTISITGSSAAPPVTVTMTLPNFYASADYPNDPKITSVTGWPYKKHHHNHHQNIILNQAVDYAPVSNSAATTLTVTYVFDNNASTLTRTVTQPNGTVVNQTIATDVKDFSISVNSSDETANTSITFQPKFRTFASSDAVTGTTYFQTTLMRNTR